MLADLTKKEWKLGRPVGSGGFGLIYLGLLIVSFFALLCIGTLILIIYLYGVIYRNSCFYDSPDKNRYHVFCIRL
jgi:hypothetical protein